MPFDGSVLWAVLRRLYGEQPGESYEASLLVNRHAV